MQGFFVLLADGVNGNPEICYTAKMMTDPISEGTLTRANDGISQFQVTATRESVSGTTTLRLVDEYANDNEQLNLPTLFDSNWEPYPMIYTIGDNKAMQIQTLKGVSTIPLGIYSNNEAEVEVKFEDVESFSGLTLYDVVTETSTTIDRDMTVMLPGCTNGRYLLTFASNIEDDMMESITISSIERGSIWVTSDVNDVIKDIIVYDINGRVCKQLSSINHYSETIAIENGIYIVKVNTEQATTTAKVFVR